MAWGHAVFFRTAGSAGNSQSVRWSGRYQEATRRRTFRQRRSSDGKGWRVVASLRPDQQGNPAQHPARDGGEAFAESVRSLIVVREGRRDQEARSAKLTKQCDKGVKERSVSGESGALSHNRNLPVANPSSRLAKLGECQSPFRP